MKSKPYHSAKKKNFAKKKMATTRVPKFNIFAIKRDTIKIKHRFIKKLKISN